MENIIEKQVSKEYEEYMKEYAIETNWKRHSSDVRDGLKVVQRRIIDSLANRLPGKTKFLKTARVVGDVIGKTHPHGDSSVKTAIKLMANWFDQKVPLIESESNMGSMQGEGDAAARYTEVKLSDFAIECVLSELREAREVVDWKATFDNTDVEPEYFPVAVPLLLVNGAFGLGVGFKTLVPSHNLGEVIDATIKLVQNPNAQVVLIPDHCMGVEIVDTNWKSISNKGYGKYTARSVIDIEDHNGCYWLVIRSMPDMVYFDKGPLNGGVKYTILDMVADGKLPQVTAIEEHSDGNDMRIVIKLRRGSDPEFVKQVLYKDTALETSYTVNFEALYKLQTMRFSYKSYLQTFIEQRRMTKYRLNCIKLQEYNTKVHELDAYIKIIESGQLPALINLVSNSKSTDKTEISEFLIKKVGLTDIQANFMLNLNILKISKGYLNQYKKDLVEYQTKAEECKRMILDEGLIDQVIIDELKNYKKKYAKPRVSRVISQDEATNIPKGIFKIVITENNYIKKLNKDEYVGAYRGDNPKHIILADNAEDILLFSAQGRVFNLPVSKIPLCQKGAPGVDARIMIKKLVSDIQAVMYVPTLKEVVKKLNKHYLVVVTNGNAIKKMDIEDFLTVPTSGFMYTKLAEGDSVKDISIVPEALDLIVFSDRKALRLGMDSIPKYKRSSLGVLAMNINDGNTIDGISIIYPESTDIVVITERGKVNRFPIAGLTKGKRASAGSSVIKLAKGDRIISVFGVNQNNSIHIHGKNGVTIVNVDELKLGSSVSAGEKILTGGDIAVACKVGQKDIVK